MGVHHRLASLARRCPWLIGLVLVGLLLPSSVAATGSAGHPGRAHSAWSQTESPGGVPPGLDVRLAQARRADPNDLAGRWRGGDGRVVEFGLEGAQYVGRYTALGGLGAVHFTLGEIGYYATQTGPGRYSGRVKWRWSDGRQEWRSNDITIKGDTYTDTASDGLSNRMTRVGGSAAGVTPPTPTLAAPPPPAANPAPGTTTVPVGVGLPGLGSNTGGATPAGGPVVITVPSPITIEPAEEVPVEPANTPPPVGTGAGAPSGGPPAGTSAPGAIGLTSLGPLPGVTVTPISPADAPVGDMNRIPQFPIGPGAGATVWTGRPTYQPGDDLEYCVLPSGPGYLVVMDLAPDQTSALLYAGYVDSSGDLGLCLKTSLRSPPGPHSVRLELYASPSPVNYFEYTPAVGQFPLEHELPYWVAPGPNEQVATTPRRDLPLALTAWTDLASYSADSTGLACYHANTYASPTSNNVLVEMSHVAADGTSTARLFFDANDSHRRHCWAFPLTGNLYPPSWRSGPGPFAEQVAATVTSSPGSTLATASASFAVSGSGGPAGAGLAASGSSPAPDLADLVGPISLGAGVQGGESRGFLSPYNVGGTLVGEATTFAAGTPRVYARFTLAAPGRDVHWSVRWRLAGRLVSSDGSVWSAGEAGTVIVSYAEPGGLPSGDWDVEVVIEGQVARRASFTVA